MKYYNVYEVLSILKEYYITSSKQMVNRWIRTKKIRDGVCTGNRKEGYRIPEDSLFEFIESRRPGLKVIMDGNQKYLQLLQKQEDELGIGISEAKIDTDSASLKQPIHDFDSSRLDISNTNDDNKEQSLLSEELKTILGQNQSLLSALLEENIKKNEMFQRTAVEVQKIQKEMNKLQIRKEQKNNRKDIAEAEAIKEGNQLSLSLDD